MRGINSKHQRKVGSIDMGPSELYRSSRKVKFLPLQSVENTSLFFPGFPAVSCSRDS